MTLSEEHDHLRLLLPHLLTRAKVCTPYGAGYLNGAYTESSAAYPLGTLRVNHAHVGEMDLPPCQIFLATT